MMTDVLAPATGRGSAAPPPVVIDVDADEGSRSGDQAGDAAAQTPRGVKRRLRL
ncbi:hypothetical protein PINS_up019838 [Pythium insidiosum]|nr:hypothetical protein PINS_up019838 [Pythium insidiosum]